MYQRDMELLDKELWGVSHNPPKNTAIIGFMAIAVFLAGMAIVGILFAHNNKQTKNLSDDAQGAIAVQKAAIALQNGVSPARR